MNRVPNWTSDVQFSIGKIMTQELKIAADCVVFDERNRLLLIQRKHPPFAGRYALPGGFVEYGETTEAAVARELFEETGLIATNVKLIGVYSKLDRDPRGHVISVAYIVTVSSTDTKAGDDAATAAFIEDWQNQHLAFDHDEILSDALKIR